MQALVAPIHVQVFEAQHFAFTHAGGEGGVEQDGITGGFHVREQVHRLGGIPDDILHRLGKRTYVT